MHHEEGEGMDVSHESMMTPLFHALPCSHEATSQSDCCDPQDDDACSSSDGSAMNLVNPGFVFKSA